MVSIARPVAWLAAAAGAAALTRSPSGRAAAAAWLPKLWAQAWSPLVVVTGAVSGLACLARGDLPSAVAGIAGAASAAAYAKVVIADHHGFEASFGAAAAAAPSRRWLPVAPAPAACQPRNDVVVGLRRDGSPLLGDLWVPPAGVVPSGLAVLFLHGGLWQALDKGFLSASLLRRLAADGHVALDLAYPLAPAARLDEMVDAVHRAIAWLAALPDPPHARRRVALMGVAGGGHLALVTAFGDPGTGRDGTGGGASGDPPIAGGGASGGPPIAGVVAISAVTDPVAYFDSYGRMNPGQPARGEPVNPRQRPRVHAATTLDRLLTRTRMLPEFRYGNLPGGDRLIIDLFGGTPGEAPDAYRRGSPLAAVRPGLPPVLQVVGDDDCMVEPGQAQRLHERLHAAGVPSILVRLPRAVHGFDQYPGVSRRIAPAAQASTADVRRFLATVASRPASPGRA